MNNLYPVTYQVIALIGIIISAFFFFYLWEYRKKTQGIIITEFGGDAEKDISLIEGYGELKKILILRYIRQQSFAFAIVAFAIAMSLILGALIILKVKDGELGFAFLTAAGTIAGGTIICTSAFKLYRESSAKIEKYLK